MTLKVDDPDAGSVAGEFENFGIAADFHNNAATNGDGLSDRVFGINGQVYVKREAGQRLFCAANSASVAEEQCHANCICDVKPSLILLLSDRRPSILLNAIHHASGVPMQTTRHHCS